MNMRELKMDINKELAQIAAMLESDGLEEIQRARLLGRLWGMREFARTEGNLAINEENGNFSTFFGIVDTIDDLLGEDLKTVADDDYHWLLKN